MKIQLSKDGATFVFPTLPEQIKITTEAGMQKYSMIALGTVNRPRGRQPVAISWDGVFFGTKRKKLKSLVSESVKPDACISKLKKWEHDGDVLKLTISGTTISINVLITKLTYKYVGGFGDIEYTLAMEEHRDLKIKKASASTGSSSKKKTKPRDESQSKGNKTLVVNTNHSNLNFRTSPNGNVITSMPKGTKITTDGETKDGWTHVCYNGKWGWAYTGYLKGG